MTAPRNTGIPAPPARTPQDSTTSATAQTAPRTILATRPLMRWRGVDLVTAAMLAVAFGVMFWGFDTFIYPVLSTATAGFPPAGELMLGVWLIPAVVGALVIRRPGAALFTEPVAANVEPFLSNKLREAVLLSGVLQALGVALAMAMGGAADDIGHTIHPHPTLSESVGMAAEVFEGTITDLYLPKKK